MWIWSQPCCNPWTRQCLFATSPQQAVETHAWPLGTVGCGCWGEYSSRWLPRSCSPIAVPGEITESVVINPRHLKHEQPLAEGLMSSFPCHFMLSPHPPFMPLSK